MSKWVDFIEAMPNPKTKVWDVIAKRDKEAKEAIYAALGQIKWYGAWRRYAFFPTPQTLFEQQCLRDIADFCEIKTKAHGKEGEK